MKIFGKRLKRVSEIRVAVDIGTGNLLCCALQTNGEPDIETILDLPTVALDHPGKKVIIAVGEEARAVIDRVSTDTEDPHRLVAIQPVRNGKIVNRDIAAALLRISLERFFEEKLQIKPTLIHLIVTVPIRLTRVQEREVAEVAISAGAASVQVVEQPMAAAIGADVYKPTDVSGAMIIDIGAGTHQVAAISGAGGNLASRRLDVGGDAYTEALQEYCKSEHKLEVDFIEAEEAKMKIGAAMFIEEQMVDSFEIHGRDTETKLGRSKFITCKELAPVFLPTLESLLTLIREVGAVAPRGIIADLAKKNSGIFLVGGGSLLRNMDKYLIRETGYNVTDVPNAQQVVVIGAAKVLGNPKLALSFARSPIVRRANNDREAIVQRPSFTLPGQKPRYGSTSRPVSWNEKGDVTDVLTDYPKDSPLLTLQDQLAEGVTEQLV